MARVIRAALTQTVNAYAPMPERVEDIGQLADKLDAVRDANVRHHVSLARRAKELGVNAICFGELFAAPYFALTADPMWRAMAEPLDGPTVSTFASLAKELEMVVVCPIYEHIVATDERYNTAVVIDATGDVLGFYSKTHIPHGANEQRQFLEKVFFDGSSGRPNTGPANVSKNNFFPVFQTAVGRVGVSICYDRHFSGVARTLAQNGAELIFSPAATFGAKSERMWELEFPVDAARNAVFIGGSNRMGIEPPFTQPYYGRSYFCGPDGRLDNVSIEDELIISEIDFDLLTAADPAGWRLVKDVREEIYDADKARDGTR